MQNTSFQNVTIPLKSLNEYAADFNEEDVVNILGLVQTANHILED